MSAASSAITRMMPGRIVRLWAQFADPKKKTRRYVNGAAITRYPASLVAGWN